MDRQPPAVHIVRLFTQEVEQLGVAHGDQEVKAIVRVAHNEEQRGPPVAQGVQLQLIVGGDLPQLGNICLLYTSFLSISDGQLKPFLIFRVRGFYCREIAILSLIHIFF